MNWYKKAQQHPWEMTREQYNSISSSPLKPNKVFYVKVGDKNVEVIQNPTNQDIRQISREVRDEFINFPPGTPVIRSTQDANGNKYCWKANEAVHASIEPQISKMVGEALNQNAFKPNYYRMIYEAIQSGKNVPLQIQEEFYTKYPDIEKKVNHELV